MQENIQIKSVTVNDLGRKTFVSLVSLIVLAVAMYVYMVQSTIVHIVDRSNTESAIRASQSKIAELESSLTILGKSVDAHLAVEMGYTEITKIDYVSRTPVLSMRD